MIDISVQIFKIILSVMLLFFVPGFVSYIAFVKKDNKEHFSYITAFFLSVLFSILVSGFSALLLAERGFFSLQTVLAISGSYSLAIVVLFRKHFRPLNFKISGFAPGDIILFLIIACAAFLFF